MRVACGTVLGVDVTTTDTVTDVEFGPATFVDVITTPEFMNVAASICYCS